MSDSQRTHKSKKNENKKQFNKLCQIVSGHTRGKRMSIRNSLISCVRQSVDTLEEKERIRNSLISCVRQSGDTAE